MVVLAQALCDLSLVDHTGTGRKPGGAVLHVEHAGAEGVAAEGAAGDVAVAEPVAVTVDDVRAGAASTPPPTPAGVP